MKCVELERKWFTTEEIAQYLGMSISQIFNLTSAGTLPYHKLGRRNRYLKEEIDDFLMKNAKPVWEPIKKKFRS